MYYVGRVLLNHRIFIIDAVYILEIWTVNPNAQATTFVWSSKRIKQSSLEKLLCLLKGIEIHQAELQCYS